MTSRDKIYKDAIQEGLYYLAMDNEELRQRALVAGLYQRAFKLREQGDSSLLDRLQHYQHMAQGELALGEMLERLLLNKDTREPAGLMSLLLEEEPQPDSAAQGLMAPKTVRKLHLVEEGPHTT